MWLQFCTKVPIRKTLKKQNKNKKKHFLVFFCFLWFYFPLVSEKSSPCFYFPLVSETASLSSNWPLCGKKQQYKL